MGTKVKTEKKITWLEERLPKIPRTRIKHWTTQFSTINFFSTWKQKPASTAYTVEQHPKISTGNIQKKKTNPQSPRNFMIISPWFVRRRLCDINIQSLLLLSGHFKNFHNNSWSRVGQNCLKTKTKVTLAKTLHTRIRRMPRT